MVDFILCVVQYILIAIVLLAVGGIGALVGVKLRKRSDAKKAAAATEE